MAKLLLVDDDPLLFDLLGTRLQKAGHTVEFVTQGMVAIELLKATPFDLVAVEMNLEATDGFELLGRIRDAKLPVAILATARGGPMTAEDYLRIARLLGAARTMSKPFTVDAFVATVDELLALYPRR